MKVQDLIKELSNLTDEQKQQEVYGWEDGSIYNITLVDDTITDHIEINLQLTH